MRRARARGKKIIIWAHVTVEDGRSGFLVPPDKPEEMAERVLKLFYERPLLEKFSAASRELSERYSVQNIARIHEKNYENLLIS